MPKTLKEVRQNPPKLFQGIGTASKPEVAAVTIAFESLTGVDTRTGKKVTVRVPIKGGE